MGKKERRVLIATAFVTSFATMMVNQFKSFPIPETAWTNSLLVAIGVTLVVAVILEALKFP